MSNFFSEGGIDLPLSYLLDPPSDLYPILAWTVFKLSGPVFLSL